MSKFSDYLRNLFDGSGESIASVARSIGAERTSIHKALADERQLPYKVVHALAAHFQLSLEERSEFFQLYNIVLQGEDTWQNRQSICDLLSQLSTINFQSNIPSQTGTILPCPDFDNKLLEGEYAIRQAIVSVINYEVSREENPTLCLYLPSDFSLSTELTKLWMNGCSFQTKELFCFPITSNSQNTAQNIRQLKEIVPLCLISRGTYLPYYFCEHPSAASLNPLNYYLITPHYLIQMSQDLSTALIQTSHKLIGYFSNRFQSLLEQCDLLTLCSSDVTEILHRYNSDTSHDSILSISSQPCLGRYFTSSVIQKYLRPIEDVPYQAVFEAAEERYARLGEIEKDYYTVFSEEGLWSFIDTGRLLEMPAQYVRPIEPEDRLFFLSSLHDEIVAGNVAGLITRPSRLRLPKAIIMYEDAKGSVHFDTTEAFPYGAYSCNIHISEKSICSAFHDFFLSLPDSQLVYTKEETLRILEKGIQKLTSVIP